MKKGFVLAMVAGLLLTGCCDKPGIFGQISQSMNTINAVAQPFYGPAAEGSPEAAMAVAAAMLAAPLADALQQQWCPSEADAKALANMASAMGGYSKAMKSKGLIK